MKQWKTVMTVLAVMAVFAVGAGVVLAQDVSTNYVPGTDFSKYKTYKWVAVEGAQKPDDIVDAQIKMAIDANMAKKGFTKATGDAADLFIAYQVAVKQETQWNTYSSGGVRWGGGMGNATSETIHIGTLALGMYDSATKALIWKGMASKTLDQGADAEKRQKNIEKAMEKLLKDFPPKPKK